MARSRSIERHFRQSRQTIRSLTYVSLDAGRVSGTTCSHRLRHGKRHPRGDPRVSCALWWCEGPGRTPEQRKKVVLPDDWGRCTRCPAQEHKYPFFRGSNIGANPISATGGTLRASSRGSRAHACDNGTLRGAVRRRGAGHLAGGRGGSCEGGGGSCHALETRVPGPNTMKMLTFVITR